MRIYKHRPNLVFDSPGVCDNDLKQLFGGKEFYELSSGKACIVHALKLWNIKQKNILVPYYICHDVIYAIKSTGNSIIFCDIDVMDLNISYESVVSICKNVEISAVVAPSLYGNSANIAELSDFCKRKKIKLLNDCAQACGATLNKKSLLEYGDASFMSISTGKPLFGFSGAYMSIMEGNLRLAKASNLYYLLSASSYLFGRVLIEWRVFRVVGKLFSKMSKIWINNSNLSIYNLSVPSWVSWYNRKIISAQLNLKFQYRQEFIDDIVNTKNYRVIRHVRGDPVGFRLILLFFEKEIHKKFSDYLTTNHIYHSNGYDIYSFQFYSAHKINKRIMDIPIDCNEEKRKYLKKILDGYS
jgi:hypothetical protein